MIRHSAFLKIIPFAVTLFSFFAVSSLMVGSFIQKKNQVAIENATQSATLKWIEKIEKRLTLYEYGLRGIRGAILSVGEDGITQKHVEDYSGSRDYDREFPGARGFGFIRRVPRNEESSFLESARQDGKPDFNIRMLSPHDGERYIIQYIEPISRNAPAVGLDIASEPNRKEAADAALRTGMPQLTGPITLVQAEKNAQQAFLILLPIYHGGKTPETEEKRRQEGFGWSYAPLLMTEVLANLNIDASKVAIELYDVTHAKHAVLFYQTNNIGQVDAAVSQYTSTFTLYGRKWRIHFYAYSAFIENLNLLSPSYVSALCALVGALLTIIFVFILIGRERKKDYHQEIIRMNLSLEAQVQERTQALTQSLKEHEMLLNSIDQHLLYSVANAKGVIIDVNDNFCISSGYTKKELIGQNHRIISSGKHTADFWREVWRKISSGNSWRGEICNCSKNGELRWFDSVITPSVNEEGVIDHYVALRIDVTPKKMASLHLANLNRLFNHVLQAASEQAIIATDTKGIITLFNYGAERMLGYTEGDVVGVSTPVIFHRQNEIIARGLELSGDYNKEISGFNVLSYKAKQNIPDRAMWTYVRKNQSVLKVSLAVTVMRDERDNIIGFLVIATDVSEDLRIKQELAQLSQHLMIAADVAELGIWSAAPSSDSLYWNDQMFGIYDQPIELKKEGVLFNHWLERLHPEDVKEQLDIFNQAIEQKKNYTTSFRLILANGDVRYIHCAASVEKDEFGNVLYVTGINQDVTQRHIYEEGIKQAKEAADSANAAKSAFLANMSHEIRTPMNAVLGMLALALKTELNTKQKDYLSKAESAANSLLGLLNDLLDFSKIDAGKMELDIRPVEIESLLQDLSIVLSGSQKDKAIDVLFDIDTHLPEKIKIDSMRFLQVLINLAGNAIKFTQKGSVTVGVSLMDETQSHASIKVSITDTGMGISPEQAEKLFQGFVQAEASTSRRFGGTGLGLAISKQLVVMMGGELHLESELGKGSCFWFVVHLEKVVNTLPFSHSIKQTATEGNLLVVSENEILHEHFSRICVDLAVKPEFFVSTEMAFNAVIYALESQQPYQAVFFDQSISFEEAEPFCKKICEIPVLAHLKIIRLLSTFEKESFLQQLPIALKDRIEVITKPFTPLQLFKLLSGNAVTSEAHKIVNAQRLEGLRLLVVEDNVLNQEIVQELLSDEGAIVEIAASGLESLGKILKEEIYYDLILMDMQMPDLDGLETTRRIRSQCKDATLPIIAMTANVSEQDKIACINAGMNGHTGKPFHLDELVEMILSFTRQRTSKQA